MVVLMCKMYSIVEEIWHLANVGIINQGGVDYRSTCFNHQKKNEWKSYISQHGYPITNSMTLQVTRL